MMSCYLSLIYRNKTVLKILNGKMVMLGLSDENMKRLAEDKPIKINLNELGLPDQEILIFTGKDEKTMYERFRHKKKH